MSQTYVDFQRHTKYVFFFYKLLGSPLEGLFYIFAFILYKDMDATPFQLTILISSKPAVALLSFYGNLFIKDKTSKLKSLIILFVLIGSLPCLLFPFIDNIWFLIFGYGVFMLSLRAAIPAWSEILKINLPSDFRSTVFSRGSIANYATNIAVPLLVSTLLDSYPHVWRWLFFAFATLNCFNVLLLLRLKLKTFETETDGCHPYKFNSLTSVLVGPWKNGYQLIKERADFRNFQIVFMLCASGLMVMQPVLPIFFKETLHLSYFQLTLATSLCKGVSFVISSPIWAGWLNRVPINLFNCLVCGFAGVFSLLLIGSEYLLVLIYGAYFIYGIMQAGSELSWNLSGPIFADKKDSTLFTGINVAAVGVRGCIAPFLGELLFITSSSTTIVFICGGCLSLLAACYSLYPAAFLRRGQA